jgi:hypothetical protein
MIAIGYEAWQKRVGCLADHQVATPNVRAPQFIEAGSH